MTLKEFERLRSQSAENDDCIMYVFDNPQIFEYWSWAAMRNECRLLFALAGDIEPKTYLDAKYLYAKVEGWGVIDGRLCVVITPAKEMEIF